MRIYKDAPGFLQTVLSLRCLPLKSCSTGSYTLFNTCHLFHQSSNPSRTRQWWPFLTRITLPSARAACSWRTARHRRPWWAALWTRPALTSTAAWSSWPSSAVSSAWPCCLPFSRAGGAPLASTAQAAKMCSRSSGAGAAGGYIDYVGSSLVRSVYKTLRLSARDSEWWKRPGPWVMGEEREDQLHEWPPGRGRVGQDITICR